MKIDPLAGRVQCRQEICIAVALPREGVVIFRGIDDRAVANSALYSLPAQFCDARKPPSPQIRGFDEFCRRHRFLLAFRISNRQV
jgi:hypothetical protein